MALSRKEKKAQKLIVDEVKKAVDLLGNTSSKYCKDHDTKAVPLVLLENYREILINNYKKGAFDG